MSHTPVTEDARQHCLRVGPHPDQLSFDAETGARALFRQHYQRDPDSRDLKGLEMASYRCIAATVLVAVGDRERAARWMIANSYATGHGDTVEDMLGELEWQAKERGAKEAQ